MRQNSRINNFHPLGSKQNHFNYENKANYGMSQTDHPNHYKTKVKQFYKLIVLTFTNGAKVLECCRI